jgi:hypothetical protein
MNKYPKITIPRANKQNLAYIRNLVHKSNATARLGPLIFDLIKKFYRSTA